jgi:surface polysaccharide O-acyltransferase-like enzyme
MAHKPKDDPSTYPALGRALTWVDKKGSDWKIVKTLIVGCIIVFALEWTYEKHSYFHAEDITGFYAYYGFVMFTALILVAKALRYFVKRPEDYYGDKAIDTEEYPEDQLDIRENTDV